jgi:cbb3-type cytochrome c oxidase subunit III
LVAAALALGACGNQPQPAAQATSGQVDSTEVHQAVVLTPSQQQGQIIFQSVCWSCHGNDGRGDGPAVQAGTVTSPPTFLSPKYADATLDELQQRFQVGIDGQDPNHPHMKYVASLLKPDKFAEALAYIPALSYPPEIPGSAIAGQQIFQYRCAPCHGPSGLGNGPAAEFLVAVKPANLTQDTLIASKDWNAVYNKIREGGQKVHGSSMPPWGIILSDNDIWDLVAYLATFQPGLVNPPAWAK